MQVEGLNFWAQINNMKEGPDLWTEVYHRFVYDFKGEETDKASSDFSAIVKSMA